MKHPRPFSTAQVHAGSIPNKCKISSDGHGIFSVPISVPPGTHKLEPKLSLFYASYHKNGLMGLGWHLGGLSAITRVGQTTAQDKKWTSVNYTESDRFALDGQRLISVSPSSGSSDISYHTELETWMKVVPVFETGIEGPAGFKVTAKNGTLMEYGLDTKSTSRVMAVGKKSVRVWALNRVTDLYGNYQTITYLNDLTTGSYAPLKIAYTGNEGQSVLPQRSVVFDYEMRTDSVIQYQGGSISKQEKRLQSISTFVEEKLVLKYVLSYNYGTQTGFSELQKIEVSDTNNIPLPPITFDWTDDQKDELFQPTQQLSAPDGIPYQRGQTFSMDVNGNGLNDVVRVWSENGVLRYGILFSNLDGFKKPFISKPTTLPFFGHSIGLRVLDINGNGKGDLVYFFIDEKSGKHNYATLISNGKEFEVSTPYSIDVNFVDIPMIIPIDINGDGRTDLVYPIPIKEKFNLQLLISDGTKFIPQKTLMSTEFPLRSIYPAMLMPADVTGNPMGDLIYAYWENEKMNVVSLISNGDDESLMDKGEYFAPAETFSYPLKENDFSRLIPIKLVADGLSDIAIAHQTKNDLILDILVSDGTRVCAPTNNITSFTIPNSIGNLIPMDITGDGRLDLLHAYKGADNNFELVPYLCDGQTFIKASALKSEIPWVDGGISSLSLDGSGKTGLFYMNIPAPDDNNPTGQWDLRLIQAGKIYPGLISTLHNGIGGSYNLGYESLATPDAYSAGDINSNQLSGLSQLGSLSGMSVPVGSEGQGKIMSFGSSPSRRYFTAPMYVVTSFERSDGNGNIYSKSYSYEGARIDLTGRGWLAFDKKITIVKENDLKIITTYYQDFPKTTKPKTISKFRLSDSTFLTKTSLEYLYQSDIPRIQTVIKTNKTIQHFTYAKDSANPDYTLEEECTYDEYGNVAQLINTSTYSDGSSNVLYTNNKYENFIDKNQLGFLSSKIISADAKMTNITSKVHYDRYPQTLGIKTKTVWLDNDPDNPLTEETTYDNYGNIKTKSNYSKDVTTHLYDETTHNTFPSTLVHPPDQLGNSLKEFLTYDLRFGKKISHTDVNGVKKHSILDDLGRVVEKYGPDPSGESFMHEQIVWKLGAKFGYYLESKVAQNWSSQKWKVKQRFYDGLKRVYQKNTFGESETETTMVVKQISELDGMNRVVKKSNLHFEGQEPTYMTKSYNPYGQPGESNQPINSEKSIQTSRTYKSNQSTKAQIISSDETKTMISTHKWYGKKRKITGFVDGADEMTSMNFDAMGRPKGIKLPNSDQENIDYDTASRKTAMNGNSFGNQKYVMDAIKRIKTISNTQGQKTIRTFDQLKRLTSINTFPNIVLDFEYDDPEINYGCGKLCALKMHEDGELVYSVKLDYYPDGKVSSETLWMDGMEFITKFSYLPTGKLSTKSIVNGGEIKHAYNSIGLLEHISFRADSKSSWVVYAEYKNYNALKKPQDVVNPISGISTLYTYNELGKIASQIIKSNAEILHNDKFDFDGLARINNITRAEGVTKHNYGKAGRLSTVVNPKSGSKTFKYDNGGNILEKEGAKFTYADRMISIIDSNQQKIVYTFDTQGRLSSKKQNEKVTNFSFDGLGNLRTVTEKDIPLRSYEYDHKGIRLKTIEHDTKKTIYTISPWCKIIKHADGSRTQEIELNGPTGIIGNLIIDQSQTLKERTFVHTDYSTSVVLTTNDTGGQVSKIEYSPFGGISSVSGADNFDKKFGSKEWDAATGLYYFNARYFDPFLGRFISPDTRFTSNKLDRDIFNRYAFVINDPINHQDPSGHGFLDIIFLVISAVEIVGGALAMTVNPTAGRALIGGGVGGAIASIVGLARKSKSDWATFGKWAGAEVVGAAIGIGLGAEAPEADGAGEYLDLDGDDPEDGIRMDDHGSDEDEHDDDYWSHENQHLRILDDWNEGTDLQEIDHHGLLAEMDEFLTDAETFDQHPAPQFGQPQAGQFGQPFNPAPQRIGLNFIVGNPAAFMTEE